MLSSSRWTYLDTLAVVAVVLLGARVFDAGAAQAEPEFIRLAEARATTATPVLSRAMPKPAVVRALGISARQDTALRCIALAELAERRACRRISGNGAACRLARRKVVEIEHALWPDGRAGQVDLAFRNRQSVYRMAYADLQTDGLESASLILRRDNAMCKRYQDFFEGRAHGQQTRQSG